MCGLIFYAFIPCENPQWAMPCYSKTDFSLRYLSLEKKKRRLQSCQNWAWANEVCASGVPERDVRTRSNCSLLRS